MKSNISTLVAVLFALGIAGQAPAQEYTENDWGWVIDVYPQENWDCGLDLGNPTLELERCYIDDFSAATGTTLTRYIFNGSIAVQIPAAECSLGHCGYVYYLTQQNNQSRIFNDGPAGQLQGTGGDEWVVFRCPEADPFCATPTLVLDDVRPVNPSCDVQTDPIGCVTRSWQLKSAFYEPNRGADGKVTVFSKNALGGPKLDKDGNGKYDEKILKANEIVMNRHLDPSDFPSDWDQPGGAANGWELAFYNNQDNRWCDGTAGPVDPDCPTYEHQYRLTDIALIPDPVAYRPGLPGDNDPQGKTNGYVGYLSWGRDNNTDPGCNCCETTGAEACGTSNITKGATFVIVKSRVGTWFVDPTKPTSQWNFVAWGGEVDFPLYRELVRRTFEVHETTLLDGSKRYETWIIKGQNGSVDPCMGGDLTLYNHNKSDWGTNPNGRKAVWYPFDPQTGVANDAASNLHDVAWQRAWIPSDYPSAFTWFLQRFDWIDPAGGPIERYLLAGSRDNVICVLDNGSAIGTGRGVWWSRLLLDGESP